MQSPGLEAAHEGEETHAPYVASGGASVSHDVNDIQTGVGNADVTAAVPDVRHSSLVDVCSVLTRCHLTSKGCKRTFNCLSEPCRSKSGFVHGSVTLNCIL